MITIRNLKKLLETFDENTYIRLKGDETETHTFLVDAYPITYSCDGKETNFLVLQHTNYLYPLRRFVLDSEKELVIEDIETFIDTLPLSENDAKRLKDIMWLLQGSINNKEEFDKLFDHYFNVFM